MQDTDDKDNETVYTFYSQQGEDIFVFRNFLNRPVTDGIFVEVGAFDGVQGSNTKFFEDMLGYTGVLIEPISGCIHHLIHNRKRSKIYNYAIHPTDSSVTFAGENPTAGILCEMSEHHKQQYYEEYTHISDVPATTLSSILTDAEISYIDFLSIDVEGAELLVLTSIDWASTEIYVICIELDGTNPEKDKACRTLLTEKGFAFQSYLGNNDIWLNLNYSRRFTRFQDTLPIYSGVFHYLNEDTQQRLPDILMSYTRPLLSTTL